MCSCGKWQITGIPCEHAYGAMIEAGLDAENYISGFFMTDMWRDTYETATYPLRGPKYWMDSTYSLVSAPPKPVLPGRKKEPKKKGKKGGKFARIKGKHESPKKKKKKKKNEVEKLGKTGKVIHCRSCGEAGHNALGCKKFPKEKVPRKRKSKNDGLDELGNKAKKTKNEKTTKEKTKKVKTQGPDIISVTQPSQGTQVSQE